MISSQTVSGKPEQRGRQEQQHSSPRTLLEIDERRGEQRQS